MEQALTEVGLLAYEEKAKKFIKGEIDWSEMRKYSFHTDVAMLEGKSEEEKKHIAQRVRVIQQLVSTRIPTKTDRGSIGWSYIVNGDGSVEFITPKGIPNWMKGKATGGEDQFVRKAKTMRKLQQVMVKKGITTEFGSVQPGGRQHN